jgi:hypothetical protein
MQPGGFIIEKEAKDIPFTLSPSLYLSTSLMEEAARPI